jgi:hypothetical protein
MFCPSARVYFEKTRASSVFTRASFSTTRAVGKITRAFRPTTRAVEERSRASPGFTRTEFLKRARTGEKHARTDEKRARFFGNARVRKENARDWEKYAHENF